MSNTDNRCRQCRREGAKLFLKGERCFSPKCPIDKKGAVPPGQHGLKRTRRLSGFGIQLRAKQKAKRFYGLRESQFRNYFEKAFKKKGQTGLALLQILESRLDNIVYRAGLAPSRKSARQLIRHGHVLVDDKKVDVSSYLLKPGQVIKVADRSLKTSMVKARLAIKEESLPKWLQKKATFVKIMRLPERDEIATDFDDTLIVEYYFR
jgi:small subunit ribosomal protein S4